MYEPIRVCPSRVGQPLFAWRPGTGLLFALSRYGGLRCPSEHLGLHWCDVDWDRSRVTIRSQKAEHHPGGGSRVIPMFPELRPRLEAVWEQAEPATEYVITKYRDCNTDLRTQLFKIIRRAGLKPWPKLFQNLRATRQTELAERFPAHEVCAWIGNSRTVAEKHCLQVTDEHYVQGVVQLSVLQPAAEPRTEPQPDNQAQKKTPVLQGLATSCDTMHDAKVGDDGLEPPTSTV